MSKALLYELGQSISFGRLSLKAKVIWPMLLAASDEQGRGIAEPDAIKWRVCPNVQEVAIEDVPELLSEMEQQGMVHLYRDGRDRPLYQVTRWWEFQQLAWAQPSRLDAPEEWVDRIRYQKKGEGLVKENWDCKGGFNGNTPKPPEVEPPNDEPGGNDELDGEQGSAYVAPTLEQGSGQNNLTQSNSIQPKEEVGATAPAATQPQNLEEWLALLAKPKANKAAVLVQMHDTLFPGRDSPSYGYVGKTAKQVKGEGRLAVLMWQAAAARATGDIMAYCQGIQKGGNNAKRSGSNAASDRVSIQGHTPRAATAEEFYGTG